MGECEGVIRKEKLNVEGTDSGIDFLRFLYRYSKNESSGTSITSQRDVCYVFSNCNKFNN